jgi:hypothetical protein
VHSGARKQGRRSQRFRALELELNLEGLARFYGLERLGLLTLTFSDDVQEVDEASKRFRSLRAHALDGRYATWAAVVERTKKGRVHFHLPVVCPVDIRTGFDFEAMKQRDYRSACGWLRAEWEYWREKSEAYGFGAWVELKPIRTDASSIGRYIGKYLVKQFGTRRRDPPDGEPIFYADAVGAPHQDTAPDDTIQGDAPDDCPSVFVT